MRATGEPTATVLEGDRGIPSVSAHKTTSVKKGLAAIFLLGIVLFGAGMLYFWVARGRKGAGDKAIPDAEQVQSGVPKRIFDLPPPPAPREVPQEATPIGLASDGNRPSADANLPAKPLLDKSTSILMVVADTQAEAVSSGAAQPGLASAYEHETGALAGMLKPILTEQAGAGVLGDRNFLLAKGAFIDCVLQTRLDSSVPGMSACVVTRDIFSDNGKVVLIERGSTVIGEYQQAVQQGMNRIFVLWTRIKTPTGVVIVLDSPGTDPLGASGLPGKVNRHFWQRFGTAMLLSLVDDAASLATSSSNDSNGGTFNYGNTSQAASDMATKTLESTLNIPPTLYKKQGERINILVSRDLNFGEVYALRTR